MPLNTTRFLRTLFEAAVAAALPAKCLPRHFPDTPADGKIIVIACGKAAAGMASAAEKHYGKQEKPGLSGVAITRYGFGEQLKTLGLIEAGHPVPDKASEYAAAEAMKLARLASPAISFFSWCPAGLQRFARRLRGISPFQRNKRSQRRFSIPAHAFTR